MSSSSAKTRSGTRISARASAGISYSVSSIRRGSNVEDHPRFPRAISFAELEIMVRRRFHDRPDFRPATPELGAELGAGKLHLRLVGYETVGVGEVDQLLEQRDEQRRVVAAGELDRPRRGLAARIELDVAAECVGGLTEDVSRGRST